MKKNLQMPLIILVILVVAVGGGLALSHKSKKADNSSTNSDTTNATSAYSNNSSSTSASKETTNPSPNPVAATTDKVSITNFAFSAAKISVKMGTKVTWTNNDSVAHTVTADSGTGPKSDNISPGGTFSYTFDTVGTFAYHCNIHPDMKGSVTVTQ